MKHKGIVFAFLAATISGFSIFYNKVAIVKGIDPLVLNIVKNGGVGILLSFMLLPTFKKRTNVPALSTKEKVILLFTTGICGSIPFYLFFTGLSYTSAVNATIIQKSLFLWVALLAPFIIKEKVTKLHIAGFMLILASNLFIGGFTGFSNTQGEWMILAATLIWSIETVIYKQLLSSVSPAFISWSRMVLGTIGLLAIALFQHKFTLIGSITQAQISIIAGSIGFLAGYVLSWTTALKHAKAVTVTSVLTLATPITNVLTAVFITHQFGQIITAQTIIGIIGVTLIYMASRRQSHMHMTPVAPTQS